MDIPWRNDQSFHNCNTDSVVTLWRWSIGWLWVRIGYSRTDIWLLPGLRLWRTVRRTIMMDWMINHPLPLLISPKRSRRHTLFLFELLMLPILWLWSNCNIYGLMISDIGASCHHCLQLGIQASHKPPFLLCISIDMFWCILGQMIKSSHILHHGLISLLQSKEFI